MKEGFDSIRQVGSILYREYEVTIASKFLTIANQEEPPSRCIASADAEQKVAELQQQINAYPYLSTSLDYEDA